MKTNLNIMLKLLLTLMITVVTGCVTGINATRSPADAECKRKKCEPGLVYHLPAPYLVVEQLSGNKWDARIEFMVDQSKEYTLQPYQMMASSSSTIEFNPDGTLKKFQLDGDATEIPDAVVKGLQEVGVKRLDLEKEKSESESESELSGASIEKGDDAPPKTGKRWSLSMYKIHGDCIEPITIISPNMPALIKSPCKPIDDKPIEGKGHVVTLIPPDSEPAKQEIKGALDDAKENFVISGTLAKLKAEDVDHLVFLKSDDTPVSGTTTTSILISIDPDAVKRSGKIVISINRLRSNKVGFIVLGKIKLEVPKQ